MNSRGGGTIGGTQNASISSELNSLIFEYLNISGMSTTLSSFVSECETKSRPCPAKETKSTNFCPADSEELLHSFDKGDLESFLQTWTVFLSQIQITSDDMKKLEVYLRVYFGIFPKANGGSEEQQVQAMSHLKNYFEENSGELSKDPTILPLFALPFVQDPKTHPVFKELLQDVWSERLRAQLEATLSKYFELLQENIGYHSKLAAVVLKAQHGEKQSHGLTNSVIHYHQDRFFQLMTTYRKVRKLLRGTRESYGKLLKVSNELISGLEQATTGSEVSLAPTIERCYAIFPELFTPELDGSGKPDKEYFKRLTGAAIFNNILDSDVSLFFIGISDLGPESLDYAKIKDTLVSDNATQSQKLCLLQSLRWLLTKTFPKCREYAMDAYTAADLLGLKGNNKEYRNKLFACMLTSSPTYLKECFARLLNAFASIKSGRSYMALNTQALDVLVTSLVTCKGENESYICQMIIATLQKMSLRKEMRLGMIERKVIQWLGLYLKAELAKKQPPRSLANGNPDIAYNPYLMEYGWALLMNLCLHEEAKPVSSAYAAEILTSVIQMLHAKPAPDVAPYVVSTLYSLLRNPDVFTMAKRMCLQETLTAIIENQSKTEMAHHLRKLVEVLNLKGYDRITTTGEVDYDDDDNADPEEFEPELEVTEAWADSLDKTHHVGDDLLVREYLIHREIVLPETPLPNPSKIPYGVHNRPTTPKTTFTPTNAGVPYQLIKANREPTTPSRRASTPTKHGGTDKNPQTKQAETPNRKNAKPTDTNTSKPGGTRALSSSPPPPAPAAAGKVKVHTSTGTSTHLIKKKLSQPRFEIVSDPGENQNGPASLNFIKGNYNAYDPGVLTNSTMTSITPSTSHPTNSKKPSPKDTLGRMMSLGEVRQGGSEKN